MNLILERSRQVPYFTEMRSVLKALGVSASDHDWFLSDIETNGGVVGPSVGGRWMTGAELGRIITVKDVQFIWGVFSAFPKGVRMAVDSPPIADGNARYWTEPDCGPELAGAEFEIVCWDSSATILIGVTDEMAARFRRTYSDARLL